MQVNKGAIGRVLSSFYLREQQQKNFWNCSTYAYFFIITMRMVCAYAKFLCIDRVCGLFHRAAGRDSGDAREHRQIRPGVPADGNDGVRRHSPARRLRAGVVHDPRRHAAGSGGQAGGRLQQRGLLTQLLPLLSTIAGTAR